MVSVKRSAEVAAFQEQEEVEGLESTSPEAPTVDVSSSLAPGPQWLKRQHDSFAQDCPPVGSAEMCLSSFDMTHYTHYFLNLFNVYVNICTII